MFPIRFLFKVSEPELKINAGCGPGEFFPRLLTGWVNLDLAYNHPKYGHVNLTSEWPFPDSSASAVYSEDFIEHLDQRGQIIFLSEALRVLRPGGIIRTVCPELCKTIVRKRFFPDYPRVGARFIRSGVEWHEWGHQLLPTREYMARILELVGFVKIKQFKQNKSRIPDFPGDKRPLSDRREEDELYLEALKPASAKF